MKTASVNKNWKRGRDGEKSALKLVRNIDR